MARVPSLTRVKQTLSESAFDPRGKTPMSVVATMNNPGYSEMKAIELIHEATVIGVEGEREGSKEKMDLYHGKMSQAISLLALARLQRGTVQSQVQ